MTDNIYCSKCNSKMTWLRFHFWQKKTYYCISCGYNFRRSFRGKVIENCIYAIGMLNSFTDAVIFPSKKDYLEYMDHVPMALFVPLKFSTNIKKEDDDKI